MTMALRDKITEDMKTAMRAGEKEKLAVIRLVLSAIKQREVDERIVLDDTQVFAVLEKMLKQRRDSVSQFQAAGREDLVQKETFEIQAIEAYLPSKLSAEEMATLIDAAIAESQAAGPKDMGKVMALAKAKSAGRADGSALSELIKQKLNALA